ncbi:hypothetical protein ACFLTQ_02060 [Chloroflexota bacterium]
MIPLDVVPLPLISYYVFQNRIGDIELLNMTHVFRQRGGAAVGSDECSAMLWNSRWPSAHPTVSEPSIILGVWWRGYYFFDKAHISAIRPFNGPFGTFSRGVQILHAKENYPQFVVFWCVWGPTRTKLISKLEEFGYPLDDEVWG